MNRFDLNKDYYAVLGVGARAGRREIRRAYIKQARRLHPDHGGVEQAMKLLNEAYSVLGDPGRRLEYDQQRGMPELGDQISEFRASPGFRGGTLYVPYPAGRTMVLLASSAGCFVLALILLGTADAQVKSLEGAGIWLLRAFSLLLLGIAVVLLNSAVRKGDVRSTGGVSAFLGGWRVIIRGVFWALAFDAAALAIIMAYVD